MLVVSKYYLKQINDYLLVTEPVTLEEKREMFHFRYSEYLKHGYIYNHEKELDIDEYDNTKDCYYLIVRSQSLNKIVGSVRIIYNKTQLPISKDCFTFQEPYFVKYVNFTKRAEISRLIVVPYSVNIFLPRHLVFFILMKHVITFLKSQRVILVFAFIKDSLKSKLLKLRAPIFLIKKYKVKYKKGPLEAYFLQSSNEVSPIIMWRYLLELFIFFLSIKYRRYLKKCL